MTGIEGMVELKEGRNCREKTRSVSKEDPKRRTVTVARRLHLFSGQEGGVWPFHLRSQQGGKNISVHHEEYFSLNISVQKTTSKNISEQIFSH